jgi:hypothetical protein
LAPTRAPSSLGASSLDDVAAAVREHAPHVEAYATEYHPSLAALRRLTADCQVTPHEVAIALDGPAATWTTATGRYHTYNDYWRAAMGNEPPEAFMAHDVPGADLSITLLGSESRYSVQGSADFGGVRRCVIGIAERHAGPDLYVRPGVRAASVEALRDHVIAEVARLAPEIARREPLIALYKAERDLDLARVAARESLPADRAQALREERAAYQRVWDLRNPEAAARRAFDDLLVPRIHDRPRRRTEADAIEQSRRAREREQRSAAARDLGVPGL